MKIKSKFYLLALAILFLAFSSSAFPNSGLVAIIEFRNCIFMALTPPGGPGTDQLLNNNSYDVVDGELVQIWNPTPVDNDPSKPGFRIWLYYVDAGGEPTLVDVVDGEMNAGDTYFQAYVAITEDTQKVWLQLPLHGYEQ